MVLKFHKKRIWICLLFLFFLVQNAILDFTSGSVSKIIGYTDELVECALIVFILLKVMKRKIRVLRYEYHLILFALVFVAMGIVSNFVTPLRSLFLSLSDMLVCIRFIVFYFGARLLLVDYCDNKELLLDFNKISRFFASLCFVLTLHDLFLSPWFEQGDYRYFAYSTKLFFSQPSFLAVACMICMAVNIACYDLIQDRIERKKNTVSIVMLCFIMVMTFRSKAIASVICIILLYFLLVKFKLQSKAVLFGSGAVLALVIGWDQLNFYYSNNFHTVLRARLHVDAMKLANESFPLGTGFGTFGSSIAAQNYSPIYTKLNYMNLHGGEADGSNFLSDTFWPTVIAQTGWIGTVAFLGILICFVYIAFTVKKKGPYMLWAMLSILVYEMISSTSEPAFFSPSVISMFIVFGLCVNIANNGPEESGQTSLNKRM